MEFDFTPIIVVFLAFAGGYLYGQYQAIDNMATKITQDPDGFINLLKNMAKTTDRDELEFQRQGNMIYCYGKTYGFIAQSTDFKSLAEQIRRQLPDSEFIIPGDQKGFSTDELYEISKHLVIKSVDNA
jgi:hypothetical protein